MRNEKFPNTVKFESAFVILCIKKNPLRVIGKYMLPDEFVYGRGCVPAKVQDARALASVIGEDELSETDKAYMEFGKLFESKFINQAFDDNRPITQSLDLGWELLSHLPIEELDRLDDKLIQKYLKKN